MVDLAVPILGKLKKVLAQIAKCQGSPRAALGHARTRESPPGFCRGCPAQVLQPLMHEQIHIACMLQRLPDSKLKQLLPGTWC